MKDDTTYIVSGYMRTGTSMMMKALEAGGLEAKYDPNRSNLNKRHGDEFYTPNIGGYYELNRKDYLTYGFPRGYEGKLIKVMGRGVWSMVAGNYKIVYMQRDYEEIRQSYEAFFNQPLPISKDNLSQLILDTMELMKIRSDIEVLSIDYRWAVNSPVAVFKMLKGWGWPINVDKAVNIVDPKQYRFKLEDLTIGI